MKYLIVSDIHGSSEYISYLFRLMQIENPDKVIILGDMLSLDNECLRILDFIEEYKDNCEFYYGEPVTVDKKMGYLVNISEIILFFCSSIILGL